MAGRVLSAVSHTADPAPPPQRQALQDFLADPSGAAGGVFARQMMKAMLARHDPGGETSRAALEIWKQSPGSPEFQVSLESFAKCYARTMPAGKHTGDPAAMLAQVHAHSGELMSMAAMAAATTDPQADPDSERARQLAQAYARDHSLMPSRLETHTATGRYRLTEYCLVPGQMYDMTGTCAENPNPQDEYDRNILLRGKNEPTFLISSRSEKDVESWVRKQALWMILGGAGLAVVCLAIILGKLGLL